jgi:small-conductance mechanosensitive channel
MSGAFVQFTGPNHAITLGGVKLLGLNAENGHKLLFTLILFAALYVLSKTMQLLARSVRGERQKTAFWARQGISLTTFILAILGFCSIWFDNPTRLTTGVGLVSAGVAFALQKVITSFAGYFVILRGKTFNVGDRIKIGNVRGDVISLNFIQTVIMEMGEPPSVQSEDPGMWVQSRQYSGRVVSVANSQIFEGPVYNYTRDFPYIWEEMHFPIHYNDRHRAEPIILGAIARHTEDIARLAQPELDRIKARFFIEAADLKPRSYMRITDNWIEFAVRFPVSTHKIRDVKDAISREIMDGLDAAKIGIASGTYDIVGLPPIKIEPSAAQSSGQPRR